MLQTLGLGLGALALPGLFGSRPAQAQSSDLTMRTIPRTGEKIPAVGLGTHMAFDIRPGQPREHLREVLRAFYDGGGRLVDVSPLYGMAEVNIGDFATALGITDKLFVAGKIWATGEWLGDDSQALRQLQRSQERLWRDRFDLLQCHSLVNAPVIMKLLHNLKQEGRVRYTGVTHHLPAQFPGLTSWVKKGNVDFVQLRYNIATRAAEEQLLPAALDTGTAVLVNMPFEKARLFQIVTGRPLPDFAADIGVTSWALSKVDHVASGGNLRDPGDHQSEAPGRQHRGTPRSIARRAATQAHARVLGDGTGFHGSDENTGVSGKILRRRGEAARLTLVQTQGGVLRVAREPPVYTRSGC